MYKGSQIAINIDEYEFKVVWEKNLTVLCWVLS